MPVSPVEPNEDHLEHGFCEAAESIDMSVSSMHLVHVDRESAASRQHAKAAVSAEALRQRRIYEASMQLLRESDPRFGCQAN